jgi:hypothetical protein
MKQELASLGVVSALLLASCSKPEKQVLPEDLAERAATCAVVAELDERRQAGEAPLPFEAHEHVLHYALLAGSTGKSFAAETTNAVIKRMKQIRPEVTESKWEKILPECRIAYPEAWTFNVELPKDRFDSKLQCDQLGKFLTRTLRKHHAEDPARAAAYAQMATKLDYRLEPGLIVRAGAAPQEQAAVRGKALSAAAKLGRPSQVMEQCIQRYG